MDEQQSPWTRKFNRETSNRWEPNNELTMLFLRAQQAFLNHRLQAYGFIFLNEVYEALGLERTLAGQVVGWLRNGENSYIDFGIKEPEKDGEFLLTFNVDGVIDDKVQWAATEGE